MREMLCFYKNNDVYGRCVWWDGFMLAKCNRALSLLYLVGNILTWCLQGTVLNF